MPHAWRVYSVEHAYLFANEPGSGNTRKQSSDANGAYGPGANVNGDQANLNGWNGNANPDNGFRAVVR